MSMTRKRQHDHGHDDAAAGHESSLPFKLLLFVMADGWHLIVRSWSPAFS